RHVAERGGGVPAHSARHGQDPHAQRAREARGPARRGAEVTGPPEFEDVVGTDLPEREQERLRRVHDLLIAAGPPAELPPHIEAGPTLGTTLARPRRHGQRRVMLLAAAVIVLALAFLG